VRITEASGTIVGAGATTTLVAAPGAGKRIIVTFYSLTIDGTAALIKPFFGSDASGNRLAYAFCNPGIAASFPTPKLDEQEECDISAANAALQVVVPSGTTLYWQIHYKIKDDN
jgi:hypothetical protein